MDWGDKDEHCDCWWWDCSIRADLCGTKEQENVLNANIVEIENQAFIVQPVEGSTELKSADRITIFVDQFELTQELKLGDALKIVYSGGILKTYPAQLENIQSIEVIK